MPKKEYNISGITFVIDQNFKTYVGKERELRKESFKDFVAKVFAKYQADLTEKQLKDLGKQLNDIAIPYIDGVLQFNTQEIFKMPEEAAPNVLGCFKEMVKDLKANNLLILRQQDTSKEQI